MPVGRRGIDAALQSLYKNFLLRPRSSRPFRERGASAPCFPNIAAVPRAGGVSPLFPELRQGVGDVGERVNSGLTSAARQRCLITD